MLREFPVVVVGAGFFGATIAERVANDAGVAVALIDRRMHIGGNSWSEVEPRTGIEYHKYGSHLFHTSNDAVWTYVRRFAEFTDYRHRVLTVHNGRIYSMPINLHTICAFYGRYMSPGEARVLIEREAAGAAVSDPQNLEEKAIASIGRPLYEAFIKHYTAKQWQTDPRELAPSIISRLPVRYSFDDRYFNDAYEGLPKDGYGRLFERMLTNERIKLFLGCDYFDALHGGERGDQIVIYTGPIDRYFDYRCGRLPWRTLDFELEALAIDDFQGTSVVNYADADVGFTRIHEFKHLHPERLNDTGQTLISREYSRFATRCDEPYYPVPTRESRAAYEQYRQMSAGESRVVFGGRLGTYRYIDMHQAIAAALKTYEAKVKPMLANQPIRNTGEDAFA